MTSLRHGQTTSTGANAIYKSAAGERAVMEHYDKLLARWPIPYTTLDPKAQAYMATILTHFKPRIGALPNLSDDELRSLPMPVLLVAGMEDAIYSPAWPRGRPRS